MKKDHAPVADERRHLRPWAREALRRMESGSRVRPTINAPAPAATGQGRGPQEVTP